ncbi:FMN-binding protein [Constantimarinum furrinae]|uniref:FMN-binding protein n=1 Tax=Constantimarinum furrinae TaxID=2562285 RepID=A0A7G8PQN9_9FLAO|nr:FMN-binding protein [Constantimarinum furrinae]QNJ96655.1 FMN-binding protein [Constantimarinum furrinae]
MTKFLLSVTAILFLCTGYIVPEKLVKKADKEIEKFYDISDFTKEAITISAEANALTPSEFGNGNLFKISSNGMHLGYGYIGNAPSKTATFDYLVLFDTQFIITKSKVLIYREEYGGEIGSKRWLQQFNGKSDSSGELVYNKDIIPISGATISVRSMTKAVNDLLKSIGVLQSLNQL